MILINETTWCYANSAYQLVLWTLASVAEFEINQLVVGGESILPTASCDPPIDLANCTWFQQMMQNWQGGRGQADASEFIHLLLSHLRPEGVSFSWEKRLAKLPASEMADIFDSGDHHKPITLQVPEQMDSAISLTDMISNWCQEWGMRSASNSVSDVMMFHIDRFYQDEAGHVHKHMGVLVDLEQCQIPHFMAYDIKIRYSQYELVGILIHTGDATNGHYRTILRMLQSYDPETPTTWIITDDNKRPTILGSLPSWVGAQAVVLSYVHCNRLGLALASLPESSMEASMKMSSILAYF